MTAPAQHFQEKGPGLLMAYYFLGNDQKYFTFLGRFLGLSIIYFLLIFLVIVPNMSISTYDIGSAVFLTNIVLFSIISYVYYIGVSLIGKYEIKTLV